MLIDIVILPPAKERLRLGTLAKKLGKKYKARYIIDDKKLIPHISLYHLCTSKNRLGALASAVKKAIDLQKPYSIEGRFIHKGRYSIELLLRKTRELNRLNKTILNNCSSLRTGPMPSGFDRKMTRPVRQAIKKYGTVGTVINYEPHITLLADFKDNKLVAKRGLVGSYKVKFVAKEVAITEVNNWYQVTRIIKSFSL